MRVSLKGIHEVQKKNPDGTVKATYVYAWRGGPRLKEKPGTPAFHAEYAAAVATRKQAPDDTVFGLVAAYKQASEFTTKRPKTRKDYLRYLKLIEEEFGDMPIEALSDRRVRNDFRVWRDKMVETPRAADFAWSVLARVFSVAKDRGKIDVNPCERGGRLYEADRTDCIWTEEMCQTAREEFPEHLRWVFMLALYTGQRQGDLLALPWSAYKNGRINLRQSKTGARVSIKVAAALKAELQQIPKRSPIILTTTERQPWTSDGFRASWGKACKKWGITGVTFHDIRGTAVTKLAELGSTAEQIATITGHSLDDVNSILDAHYLSRTNALGDAAIARLDRNERRRKSVKSAVNQSAEE
jgi:integrase